MKQKKPKWGRGFLDDETSSQNQARLARLDSFASEAPEPEPKKAGKGGAAPEQTAIVPVGTKKEVNPVVVREDGKRSVGVQVTQTVQDGTTKSMSKETLVFDKRPTEGEIVGLMNAVSGQETPSSCLQTPDHQPPAPPTIVAGATTRQEADWTGWECIQGVPGVGPTTLKVFRGKFGTSSNMATLEPGEVARECTDGFLERHRDLVWGVWNTCRVAHKMKEADYKTFQLKAGWMRPPEENGKNGKKDKKPAKKRK